MGRTWFIAKLDKANKCLAPVLAHRGIIYRVKFPQCSIKYMYVNNFDFKREHL